MAAMPSVAALTGRPARRPGDTESSQLSSATPLSLPSQRGSVDHPRRILALLPALLPLADALTLAGCASSPGPRFVPDDGRPIPARLSAEEGTDVTIFAMGLVGTPYRYGGNTPAGGFDCSGLIHYVYRTHANIASPRTVAALAHWGQPVPAGAVRTGDLVVFIQGSSSTHAGIYVGENRFVHAPSTGGEVRLDRLTSVYWSRQQYAFRRP